MTDEEYISRSRRPKGRRYRGHSRMTRVLIGAYVLWCLALAGFVLSLLPAKAKAPALDKEPVQIVREEPQEAEQIEAALAAQGYFRADVPLSYELQDVLQTECERYGIEYALALGLIETESSFREDADNGLCYGLMQLNRDWFPDRLTPAENIRAGMEYLAYQLNRYDSVGAALTAYNAGHDTGTRGYAKAVLEAAEGWKRAIENPPAEADG